jgi:hypothetical protein
MANLQKCKDAKHEVYVIKYLYFIILMVRLQCFTLQFFTLKKEYVMKKFIRKALASMLVFTMCFSSVNISAFAQNVSYPRFHENSDIIHGLTICVNDTWGNTVEVKDYNFDGEHFSGTLHFCIYDHFGLDQPDVEKTYVNLAGFRAWYVLQHYDYFNGSFVPFVTLMEFDVPFESDIIMFKPGK